MGKTAFSGPVYGAKSLLHSGYCGGLTSGASTQVCFMTVVPSYEDWYITESFIQCSSCSTGAAAASSIAAFHFRANGTKLHSSVIMADTSAGVLTTITPTAGEYEGARVAAGSTIALIGKGGSTAVAPQSIRGELRGYIRYIDSTRAS